MNVSACPAGTEDEDGGCNTERVKAKIIVKNKRDEIIQGRLKLQMTEVFRLN